MGAALAPIILGHAAPTVTRRVYAQILREPTTQQVTQALELVTRHRQASTRVVSNGEQS